MIIKPSFVAHSTYAQITGMAKYTVSSELYRLASWPMVPSYSKVQSDIMVQETAATEAGIAASVAMVEALLRLVE